MMSPLRVEIAVWGLICGGLAVWIGVESDWGRQWQYPLPAVEMPTANFSAPPLTEPFKLPAADEFLEVALRPVFIVTRRPAPPPPPPEAPKPTMKRGQFVLKGITVVGSAKFAFVSEKSGNKSHVLSEGKEINGLKVKEITATRVILGQFDETETLTLQTAKGPAVAAPPAATAPPPSGGPAPRSRLTPPTEHAPGLPAGQN